MQPYVSLHWISECSGFIICICCCLAINFEQLTFPSIWEHAKSNLLSLNFLQHVSFMLWLLCSILSGWHCLWSGFYNYWRSCLKKNANFTSWIRCGICCIREKKKTHNWDGMIANFFNQLCTNSYIRLMCSFRNWPGLPQISVSSINIQSSIDKKT